MSENNRSGCFGSARFSQNGFQSADGGCASGNRGSGRVLIDTYQVFDSCRDRDCFEDTRVFLDEFGQSLIEHTNQVRTKSAEICSSSISVEPVQLSRGFYRITVRFYVRLELEACVCPGKPQTFCGIAATEKSAVLFGGEGEVRVFRSNTVSDSFCSRPCTGEMSTNLPIAVVETVDPVILGTRVVEPHQCRCCCCRDDIPEPVTGVLGGTIVDGSQRYLAVSLGFFSVIRLERPEQYLIEATELSVPDKECECSENGSPCDAFARMAFPVEEFAPGRSSGGSFEREQGCGCRRDSDRSDNDRRDCDRDNGRQSSGGCGCGR